jgi:DNA-binding transcriptional LysR family regulator
MLMAMEIGQIEALVAVARLGGFTRAAAALNLSQPAVSRRLGLLEGELGAPLFERIPSGIVLTAAGQAFLPHAEALLASMRDGVDAVRALVLIHRRRAYLSGAVRRLMAVLSARPLERVRRRQ